MKNEFKSFQTDFFQHKLQIALFHISINQPAHQIIQVRDYETFRNIFVIQVMKFC